MFSLFQSIFGTAPAPKGVEPYPDWLVDKAIEGAVDGLDARLRMVGGYRKRLRPSVVQAIDHVVKLVDGLPPPLDASRAQYGRDPYLTAFFVSADELQQFFSDQRGVWEYLDNLTGTKPERIVGLLMMDRHEKRIFGMELEGEMLRRDVAQTTVNFGGHQLLDPNGEEQETRRFLKRRAFDHLIALALEDVISIRRERSELEEQHALLRRKLTTLEAEGWGFNAAGVKTASNHAAAYQELQEIESRLKELPAKTEFLSANLDILAQVFNNAPRKLSKVPVSMVIDRTNIRRKAPSGDAAELVLDEFHSASGEVLTGCMVGYPTDELLPREAFLSGVERYLH